MVKKRGRKSVGDLTTIPAYPPFVVAPALCPPDTLEASELAVWHQTVGHLPRGWFGAEQTPVLEAFCWHSAEARRLRALLRDGSADDVRDRGLLLEQARKESALVLRTATALRLTVQSRAHAVTAGRRAAEAVPVRDIRALLELADD